MKAAPMRLPLLLLAALSVALPTHGALFLRRNGDDSTITKVIKMLEVLMKETQKEGDVEHKAYAKFKCHCDTTSEDTIQRIASLKDKIAMDEATIAKAKAHVGDLGATAGHLKATMDTNKADLTLADSVRLTELTEFGTTEKDLESAITSLQSALDTLGSVNAEQDAAGADHEQYMGDFAGVQKATRAAMLAASSFVNKGQAEKLDAFLQGGNADPAYSSKSGAIFGILANMKDTFEQNLEAAMQKEKQSLAAHIQFVKLQSEELQVLKDLDTSIQEELSHADEVIAQKILTFTTDTSSLDADEGSLGLLQEACEEKSNQHESRKTARASEQVALSQAIAILNSDAAFATFGKVVELVEATSKDAEAAGQNLGFVQLRGTVIRPHVQAVERRASAIAGSKRQQAAAVPALVQARGSASAAVRRILSAVQAGNPFKIVLEEIQKMIKLIEVEGEADTKKKDFCDVQRINTRDSISAAVIEIGSADDRITDATTNIKTVEEFITDKSGELQKDQEEQQETTETRKTENELYVSNVKDAVEARAMLKQAINILKVFYERQSGEDTAAMDMPQDAPATWSDGHQSIAREVKSTAAISALVDVFDKVESGLSNAHAEEAENQRDFEETASSAVEQEAVIRKSLADARMDLAVEREKLSTAKTDLETHTKEKLALDIFLEKIKPGCDFISDNLLIREGDRVSEAEELGKASVLLKNSPAYLTAMEHQEQEEFGDCKDQCNVKDVNGDTSLNKDSVECRACLAKVSIPGYCAGNPGQQGCPQ